MVSSVSHAGAHGRRDRARLRGQAQSDKAKRRGSDELRGPLQHSRHPHAARFQEWASRRADRRCSAERADHQGARAPLCADHTDYTGHTGTNRLICVPVRVAISSNVEFSSGVSSGHALSIVWPVVSVLPCSTNHLSDIKRRCPPLHKNSFAAIGPAMNGTFPIMMKSGACPCTTTANGSSCSFSKARKRV